MKKYLLLLLCVIISSLAFSQGSEIESYVDFLKLNDKRSAKEYILQKFKNHDVVILCERDHRELMQYELVKEILNDKYFKKHIANLFTEIGVVNLNPEINKVLRSENLDSVALNKKLAQFQQNAEFFPVWEKYDYQYLLRTIYEINKNSKHKISYYPSDVEFDWSKIKDSADYTDAFNKIGNDRDSLIAYNIINQFRTLKKKKALIILNYRHAFKLNMLDGRKETIKNTATYLFDFFGKEVFNVLINPVCYDLNGKEYLIQSGKWDASFKYLKSQNTGFDLENSPFGKDNFDYWAFKNPYTYEDVFGGVVFYKPIEDFRLVWNFKGFIPKEFENEFIRRLKIFFQFARRDASMLDNTDNRNAIIEEYNTKTDIKLPNLTELLEQRDKYLK